MKFSSLPGRKKWCGAFNYLPVVAGVAAGVDGAVDGEEGEETALRGTRELFGDFRSLLLTRRIGQFLSFLSPPLTV